MFSTWLKEKVVDNITRKDVEELNCSDSHLHFQHSAEDLENFVERASLEAKSDVMLADVNHYRVNELLKLQTSPSDKLFSSTLKRLVKGDLQR